MLIPNSTFYLVPIDVKPSYAFGEWSEWTLASCTGKNAGGKRSRKRWCSDGSTIKDPACCYGKMEVCDKPIKSAETQTEYCTIKAYWGTWGPWKGDCLKERTKKQIRNRICVAGNAGKAVGCKD